MSDIQWKCEKRSIDELKPHPDNPRVFTEKGMKDLGKSIDKIGMAQPINITPEGTVLSGHARLLALKQKGIKEVDVYVASRSLTAKEQQEVLIRMNANTAGEWNTDTLANIFDQDDLTEWGLDLPWEEEPLNPDNPDEPTEDFDVEKQKVKIVFYYKDSHEIIDKFLREMKEKYPELLYEVEINDQ